MPLVITRQGLAKLLVVLCFIIFGGAFVQQVITGPHFERDVSAAVRIINAATYLPIHMLGLLIVLWSWRESNGILRQQRLLLAYVALGACSFLWALEPGQTLYTAYALLMTILCATAIAATLRFEHFAKVAAYTLLVCAIASAIYIVLIPSWGVMSGGFEDNTTLAGLPQGVFRHKNQLAEVMAAGVIFAYCVGDRMHIVARLALAVVAGGLLIASESAGKLLGVIFALAAYLAWRWLVAVIHARWAALLIALFALFAAGLLFSGVAIEILPDLGKDATLSGRVYIWAHALAVAARRPILGYGLASIWQTPLGVVPQLNFAVPHAHNLWIEIYVELGVVGLLLAVSVMIRMLTEVLTSHVERQPYFAFAVMILVSAISRSATEVSIFQGNDITSFLLFVAVAYNCRHLAARVAAHRPGAREARAPFPVQVGAPRRRMPS